VTAAQSGHCIGIWSSPNLLAGGGLDLIVATRPGLKVEWEEKGVIGDATRWC